MEENKSSVVLKRTTELNLSSKQKLMDALAGPLRMVPVILALVAIWLIFTILDTSFMSPRNLTVLSIQIVNMGVMSIGLFLVLLLGELDLSCAASSAVCSAIAATVCIIHGAPFIVGLIACIATGVLVGAVQGWFVTFFKAPAFIITLGSQMILEGALLIILKDNNQISIMNSGLGSFTNTYLPEWLSIVIFALAVIVVFFMKLGVHRQALKNNLRSNIVKNVYAPTLVIFAIGVAVLAVMHFYRGLNLSVVILLGLLAIFSYMLTQTKFGVHLYALGGNQEAVRRAGINVQTTKWAVFIIASAVFAFAGLIAASRVQSVSVSSIDDDIMMNSIAACVLGGASLTGGKGNIWGILLGSLVMGSLTNGMYLIGAETSLRLALQGIILIAAIILDAVIANSTSRK